MVVYASFYEAFKNLPQEDFGKCLKMLFDYGLYGIEPQEEGVVMAMFLLIKPQIDSNNQKWLNSLKTKKPNDEREETASEKEAKSNQTSTKTKAKRKQNDSETQAKCNQTESETEANVYDNVNVYVNENVNEKENENVSVCENVNTYENASAQPKDSSAEAVCMYGEYKNIKMTPKEYEALKSELGYTRLSKCIEFFSRYLARKPEYRSAKHYEDLRDWVLDAVKKKETDPKSQNMQKKGFYGSQWDFDLNELFEKPDPR